jgi:RNA polymerase sigma-70 factor (ECF subfamily)
MKEDGFTEDLAQARGGDPAAFERLAAACRPRLEALVRTRLGAQLETFVEVDDVVQETFLRALRSIARFEESGTDSFLRWLGGIANHVLLEAAKRHRRDLILPLDAEVADGGLVSPSRAGMRRERFERLERALAGLNPDHRRVIVLARLERLPIKEVAARMERTPGATAQLLWRALQKLKESFGSTDRFHLPPLSLEEPGGPA